MKINLNIKKILGFPKSDDKLISYRGLSINESIPNKLTIWETIEGRLKREEKKFNRFFLNDL